MCDYCEKRTLLINVDTKDECYDCDCFEKIDLIIDKGHLILADKNIGINFCPMCGKGLKNINNQNCIFPNKEIQDEVLKILKNMDK